MAISFVDAGAHAYANSTAVGVDTPAGSVGDLVLFVVGHDDHSDGWGRFDPISEPITLTQIIPSLTYAAGDFGAFVWWGIEDQAAARTFNFGTLAANEGTVGICLRFSGTDSTTPILSGSTVRVLNVFPSLIATRAGQWFVSMFLSDIIFSNRTAATGWTARMEGSTGGAISYYVMTKPAITEELKLTNYYPTTTGTSGVGWGFGFVLDVDSPTAYTISGVTKDKDGTALGSCTVVLLKDAGTNDWKQISTQTSNATTGAYSFTVYDNDAKYMVIAYKGDTPHVFDVTDYVLQPSA